jgi:hypothetical protein
MHICIYMCVWDLKWLYINIYVYMYIYIYTYINWTSNGNSQEWDLRWLLIYIYIHIYRYIFIYIYEISGDYIYICIYIYIYKYIYIYVYIHIYAWQTTGAHKNEISGMFSYIYADSYTAVNPFFWKSSSRRGSSLLIYCKQCIHFEIHINVFEIIPHLFFIFFKVDRELLKRDDITGGTSTGERTGAVSKEVQHVEFTIPPSYDIDGEEVYIYIYVYTYIYIYICI